MSTQTHSVEWKPGSLYRIDGGPWMEPGVVEPVPPHVHEWHIDKVQVQPEAYGLSPAPEYSGRVAYLLCQCGAVKRTVVE